jgi:hypothetical protein
MLLARTPAERLAMGSQMFEAARAIMLASLPPGLSATEIRRRLCERLYGDEVDLAAFSRRLDAEKPVTE